jgi:hypothetical protein
VSGEPKIPFTGWSPHRNRSLHDVAAGRLTPAQGRVEEALYTLASPDTFRLKLRDLHELAKRIGWEFSLDYLGKTLNALRVKGLIAYETPARQHPSPIRDPAPLQRRLSVRAQSEQERRAESEHD